MTPDEAVTPEKQARDPTGASQGMSSSPVKARFKPEMDEGVVSQVGVGQRIVG